MFSIPSSPLFPQHHTPPRALPLTPRSQNIPTPFAIARKMFSMPPSPPETPQNHHKVVDSSTSPFTFTATTHQQSSLTRPPRRESLNPLNRSADQRANERRQRYLHRVRDAREDARLDVRGQALLHSEWLEQQRAWELAQAREAPGFDVGDADEVLMGLDEEDEEQGREEGHEGAREGMDVSQDEWEDMLAAEEREMAELVAMQEREAQNSQDGLPVLRDETMELHEQQSTLSVYGSDDDEFDQLLLNWSQDGAGGQDQMDMSDH